MHVTLDMADAMELEQLLDFLACWIKAEHACLAPSLARFLGTDRLGSEMTDTGPEWLTPISTQLIHPCSWLLPDAVAARFTQVSQFGLA